MTRCCGTRSWSRSTGSPPACATRDSSSLPFVPPSVSARASLVPYAGMEVRDFWPRVLVSPILGALVANLSGLIDHTRHSTAGLVASYAWFATVAFLIWEGNRRLYFRLPRREDWLLRPWRRLGTLLTLIVLFTMPAATALLWMWRETTGDAGTRPYALPTALFAVVALVVAIT